MILHFIDARRTPAGLEDALQVAFVYTVDGAPQINQIYMGALGTFGHDPAFIDELEQKLFGAALSVITKYYQQEHMLPDPTREYWERVDFASSEMKPISYQGYQLELLA